MNKDDNLIDISTRPKEEHSELARRGALRAAEVKREKANFRKILESILTKQTKYEDVKMTYAEALALSCIEKGIVKGDCDAMAVIRDTIGQKPVDVSSLDITTNTTHQKLLDDIAGRVDLEK